MHRLRASYSRVPLCQNLLSDQIRSYCKKITASRTNCIVIPLRRCVSRRCVGIETCYVFHCAVVSSSYIFGTAVSITFYWSIATKLSCQSSFVRKIKTAVPKIWYYDMICPTGNQFFAIQSDMCPDSDFWHIGAVKPTGTFLRITIRFVETATVFMLYDIISSYSCEICS